MKTRKIRDWRGDEDQRRTGCTGTMFWAREARVKHQLALLIWDIIEIISSLYQYCTLEHCTRQPNSNRYKRAAIRRLLINQHQ